MKKNVNGNKVIKLSNGGVGYGNILDGKRHGVWKWLSPSGRMIKHGFYNRGIQYGNIHLWGDYIHDDFRTDGKYVISTDDTFKSIEISYYQYDNKLHYEEIFIC